MSEQRLRLKHGRTGEYRWHLAQAVPLRNMEGRIILWVGTNTDIHAQQLQQQELQQVNTDLDNFIYTASHDLKTPISNIEALLAELREELQLPAEEADPTPLLDYMQQAVERFKRTIFHLTEVVKLQKAQDQPETRVELAELIQEVRLDLQPLIAATGGHISVDVAACPSLGFSEKNLRSIVFNLLSNALKYRHPERPPQVRISCQPNAEYFVLCVQDNGLGISLNPLSEQKLFGLFQRLHDHVEGSGIGLYMVKKMITNVGGRIEVESQPGTGSTFRVYFPK
jgi:signal transduction histidine kinase